MNTEQYDIFLSYRRQGGFETAKHLYDLLTRDGYSVSFDIDTLRQGDFDTTLLRRIDQCTDFILILNEGAFDRTLDPAFDRNKDWMRIELAHALKLGKNIIPVMLGGFTEFPDNLPEDIARVRRKNGPKYDQYYFDAFYKKLLLFLDSRPSERGSATSFGGAAAGSSTLKIRSDAECRIFVDDEERGIAHAGQLFRLPLRGGSYLLRFESVENSADTVEETWRIEKDIEELYSVALLPVKRQREERETVARAEEEKRRRREAYLLQLPDERFGVTHDDGEGTYGFVDRENDELLIPFAYDWASDFSEGLAAVMENGKYGFIDKTGKTVIPAIYDKMAWSFSESLAQVKKDEKYGFIDKTRKAVIPAIYDKVWFFCEGLAAVMENGKYGFIDKTGKVVVPIIYDGVENFSEGLARVCKDGKWGFIDKTGKVAIPLIYVRAENFREGLAWVINKDKKWGFIDKTGRWVKDDD